MKIIINNAKLCKLYETVAPNNKYNFPLSVIWDVIDTLQFIQNAENITIVKLHPNFRYHSLKGDKQGTDAISINNQGYRMELEVVDAHNVIIKDVSLHYGD
ncbi:MAG: type II toxin-antitoxin system RelE/ParE family toxin, partial [Ignavibacteria bacterium]|nr:type II toxin-antitoxin system RelE/ParE family toxin [Ignavibacteria bacterium]